jgi:hypothetical protein
VDYRCCARRSAAQLESTLRNVCAIVDSPNVVRTVAAHVGVLRSWNLPAQHLRRRRFTERGPYLLLRTLECCAAGIFTAHRLRRRRFIERGLNLLLRTSECRAVEIFTIHHLTDCQEYQGTLKLTFII